ncbi:hypothetical protein SAMN05444359_13739 [Neolewinella agarilytica]|uniref:Uncharacterized protein n=1 Tax=Neolewinella agarilytica TaxID=478744 RepID=A0A1H9NJR1_9BACT|nr:hypothetical protein SAMN05444359_13739 [Neolewinella agarilytica]
MSQTKLPPCAILPAVLLFLAEQLLSVLTVADFCEDNDLKVMLAFKKGSSTLAVYE